MVAVAVSLFAMPCAVIWRPSSDSNAAKYAVGVNSEFCWRSVSSMAESRTCVWIG
jgi:hypothetical protein